MGYGVEGVVARTTDIQTGQTMLCREYAQWPSSDCFSEIDRHSLEKQETFFLDVMEITINSYTPLIKWPNNVTSWENTPHCPFLLVQRCLHYAGLVFTDPRKHILLVHETIPMKMDLNTEPYYHHYYYYYCYYQNYYLINLQMGC
jgi:hypothetical protein